MILLSIYVLAAGVLVWLLVRWLEPRLAFFPTQGESETPRSSGVPFDAITIDTADGEHLRVWMMRAPAPRANVVYFHGNGANLSNWSPILAGIVKRGYSVFAFDYRGYGLSTGRPTERGLYRDVDAVVKHARTGPVGIDPDDLLGAIAWSDHGGVCRHRAAAGRDHSRVGFCEREGGRPQFADPSRPCLCSLRTGFRLLNS